MVQIDEEMVGEMRGNREQMFAEVMARLEGEEGVKTAVRRLYLEGKQEGFTARVAREVWMSVKKGMGAKRDLGVDLTGDYRRYIDGQRRQVREFRGLTVACFTDTVDEHQKHSDFWRASEVLTGVDPDNRF